LSQQAQRIFALDASIRYVAVVQSGEILEMSQSPRLPTQNPHDTDRLEELLVNPVILRMAVYRGNLDMGGTRYVVIRYGTMYQIVFPYELGHVSVAVELAADVARVGDAIARTLGSKV